MEKQKLYVKHKSKDLGLIAVYLFLVLFVGAFSYINILKYNIFSMTSFGWQIIHLYEQIAKGKDIFSLTSTPNKAVIVLILCPINFIFAFFYNLLKNRYAIYIFQTIIMFSGAVPVYLLAKLHIKDRYLAFAFAFSFLLHPVITSGAALGYIHPAAGMPLLLFAFYFLEKSKLIPFTSFIIFANMAKFEVTIMNFIYSIILFFSKHRNKFGRIILKINFFWILVTITLSFLYLRTANKPFLASLAHLDQHGEYITDVFRYLLANPFSILRNIFDANNWLVYVLFHIPNFFGFFSPSYLLPIIPSVGFILLRDQHSSSLFLIMPFVFAGAIFGTKNLITFITNVYAHRFEKRLNYGLACKILAAIIVTFALTYHYFAKPRHDLSNRLGPLPFTRDFNLSYYKETEHIRIGHDIIRMIPAKATCLTLEPLASNLIKCEILGIFSKEILNSNFNWDYIFFDFSKNIYYKIDGKKYVPSFEYFLKRGDYGVVVFENGWVLLKKSYKNNRNNEVLSYLKQIE